MKRVLVLVPSLCLGCDNTVRTEDDGEGLSSSGTIGSGGTAEIESCSDYLEARSTSGCPEVSCGLEPDCEEETLDFLQCMGDHAIPGPDGDCVDDEGVCVPLVVALNDCMIARDNP